ncbi:LysR family transcriptional regulator [Rathayibacter iranicus]|uniref:LysR family transcriptional regulator n=2 Tax=Rathayibacter iranicus TaxID=59737 RepID=A0AAD1ADQ5_9MICO|nr:LysR family transcriptional regulator [Rathayibacter iranicus]AZZ56254.1 LysR family transcriptional regulator [Rathayibacter iranicus]MWV30036.1 LysR family transcriptional regulator [Rathayibacter iranicus NCPPB 2253 = VKM Ac-1602]PPI45866.1 LysR family transcriptional regulator [Rathayibacter iranicus]PPI59695.1 LysR family transcriptional regulator [Rathayibacter iranicus]PPI70704.1 LysR family transcriptional regulator [Rathayibacter iranicus]
MPLELRQVRIFVTVADELHFGRAAAHLRLPPSVVSEQVKKLERLIGVELFDRSHRAIALTSAGSQLVSLGRSLLHDAECFIERARAHEHPGRVLRLGIGLGMGRRLAFILRRLAHAGLSVRTVSVPPRERSALLEAGDLDAAFIRGRVRGSLIAHHVWDDELVAALPEHHPLAAQETVQLADLARSPAALVSQDVNPALHDVLSGGLAALGLRVEVGMRFSTIEATFAELVAHPTPMWTPVFAAYEAEHVYEGISIAAIQPRLTLPAFLAVHHRSGARLQVVIDASRESAAPSGARSASESLL